MLKDFFKLKKSFLTLAGLLLILLSYPASASQKFCLSNDGISCSNHIVEENFLQNGIGLPATIYSDCEFTCPHCTSLLLEMGSSSNFQPLNLRTLVQSRESGLNTTCLSCNCKKSNVVWLAFKTVNTDGSLNYNLTLIPMTIPKTEGKYSEDNWINKNPWSITNNNQVKRDLAQNFGIVNITFNNPTLRVISPNIEETFTIVRIRSESFLVVCKGNPCLYEIPEDFLVLDASMEVITFIGDVFNSRYTFTIVKEDTCTIVQCSFICKEYFTHFICYSTSTQIFISISFIVSCLVLVLLIGFLFSCFFKSNFISNVYGCIIKYRLKQKENDSDLELSELESDSATFYESDSHQVQLNNKTKRSLPKVGGRKPGFALCLLICCLIAPIHAECIGTSIVASDIVECFTQLDTTECLLSVNTQILLPSSSSSACLSFFDKGDGRFVGELKITLLEVSMEIYLRHLYYTSQWEMISTSSKFCSTTTTWCENGCNLADSRDSSMLSGESTQLPGVTECRASCGCAGCGCVVCDDACLYSRYAIKTHGSAYRVTDFFGSQSLTKIGVSWSPGNTTNDQDEVHTILQGGSSTYQGFNFVIAGVIRTPLLTFLDQKVINNNEHAFMAHACDLNNPQYGAIGDIQASYHDWLEQPPFSFNFPSQVVHSTASSDDVTYSYQGSQLNYHLAHEENDFFPVLRNDILWSFTPDKLVGNIIDTPPVLLYVSTTQPIRFELNVTRVCPKISFLRMTGCYQCTLGASLVITAKSLCDVGAVKVEYISDNHFTLLRQSISLTKEDKEFIIPLLTTEKDLKGMLQLSYMDYSDSKYIAGVLTDPPTNVIIHQPNQTNSNFTTKPLSEQTFTEWWDSLVGPLQVVKYIIAILLGLVASFCALSVIVAIFKLSYNMTKAYRHV